MQLAERLWPLVDEAIANQAFADLDALEGVLVARCRTLWKQRGTIRNLTCYHWWPSDSDLAIRQ